jgi:hypothetical protein
MAAKYLTNIELKKIYLKTSATIANPKLNLQKLKLGANTSRFF